MHWPGRGLLRTSLPWGPLLRLPSRPGLIFSRLDSGSDHLFAALISQILWPSLGERNRGMPPTSTPWSCKGMGTWFPQVHASGIRGWRKPGQAPGRAEFGTECERGGGLPFAERMWAEEKRS